MSKLWQIITRTQPILPESLQPEVTSLDKWHSPLSVPTRRTAWGLVAAAIIASGGLIDPNPREEGDADEASVIDITTPISGKLKYQYQAIAQPIDFGIAAEEEITLDKWYQPHSEPVRVKPRASSFPEFGIDSDALTRPEVTSLDKWWSAFSEPVRVQARSLAALISGAIYEGEPRDVEPLAEFLGWYRGLDEPILPKVLPVALYPATFYQDEISELDPNAERLAWYEGLAEPVKVKKPLPIASYPASWDDADALTRPETTTLDRWFQTLSEPLQVKEPINVSFGEFRTELEISVVEDITLDKWYQPFSEPDIRARKIGYLFGGTTPGYIEVAVEDITLDKWYQPHSEPVLVKLRASDFPSHTNDTEGLTLPEVTSLDRWWVAASEPLRVKQPLNVSFGEFRTELEIVAPEVITLDKWYSPHSEPIRVQPRSLAGLLSDAVYEGEPVDVEPLAEFMGWFRGLDEPVLPRVLPVALYPVVSYQDEISELDPSAERLAWFKGLSTPTLPKPRVAEFPTLVIDSEALTQPEVTTLDKWFVELSEPLRTKPPLPTGAIPTLIESLEPIIITVFGWDVPLSEPIFIIDPTTPLKPSFFIDPEALTLPETTTLDKWFTPLSEPVRVGDRLIVPRLPAAVGFKLPITITVPIKSFTSKEADQTHISKEADMTKDNPRC